MSARFLPDLLRLAERAGAVILEHYAGAIEVRDKADRSPVTAADEAAELVILAGLKDLAPTIPAVAEEAVAAGRIPEITEGRFWLVDPLDGTKEFISRNGEFTVNIALVENGAPIIGVVLAPAIDAIWWGAAGAGAHMRRDRGETVAIKARPRPSQGLRAMASRSHGDAETEAWLTAQGVEERVPAGSSLKFCLLAEGRADFYPRFGTTMEWDTAAGHAVLAAAGGRVMTRDDQPLGYHKPGFKNPGFIAYGA